MDYYYSLPHSQLYLKRLQLWTNDYERTIMNELEGQKLTWIYQSLWNLMRFLLYTTRRPAF